MRASSRELQAPLLGQAPSAGAPEPASVAGVSGKPMIVEFPDPDCLDDTLRFKKEMIQARAAFILMFGLPTAKYRVLEKPVPVVIGGVVFFNRLHLPTGVADNRFEFHSVLG